MSTPYSIFDHYAQIQALEPDSHIRGRCNALSCVGQRRIAMNAVSDVCEMLSEYDTSFVHIVALRAVLDGAVNGDKDTSALDDGELGFDEIKRAALEALQKEIDETLPGVANKIREGIREELDSPKDDMKKNVADLKKSAETDVFAAMCQVEKHRKATDAAKKAAEKASIDLADCRDTLKHQEARLARALEMEAELERLDVLEAGMKRRRA
jgi:hypothetical protein